MSYYLSWKKRNFTGSKDLMRHGYTRVIITPSTSTALQMAEKEKNTIFHLKDGNNIVVGDKILLEHATLYYKTLFGPANNNVLPLEQSF